MPRLGRLEALAHLLHRSADSLELAADLVALGHQSVAFDRQAPLGGLQILLPRFSHRESALVLVEDGRGRGQTRLEIHPVAQFAAPIGLEIAQLLGQESGRWRALDLLLARQRPRLGFSAWMCTSPD